MDEPTETKLTENAERLTSTLASLSAAMNAQGIASSLGTKSATALKIAEDLRIKQLSSLLKISEREARAKLATIKAEEDHSKAQDQIAADEAKRNKEAEEQAEKVKKAIEGAMKKAVDTVGGFAKGVLSASQASYNSTEAFASAVPMLTAIGTVIKGVSSVLATAFSAMPIIGGLFGAADKAVGIITDISLQVMEIQLANAQKYVTTYNTISKAGATFGGSLTAMGVAAGAAGVNLASFGKFITASAEDLSKLGSGITAAAGAVSKMGKEVLTNNKQLLVMYGGYDEVNSALATYSARLAASGYNTVTNQAKVNAGAKDYLFNLKTMTDLTGMSAKTMQAAENERLQEADYQAAKLAMGEKGLVAEQAMNFATAGLGKEFAKYAAEYFANGRIISATGQKLQAFNSAATQTARELVDLAKSGIGPGKEFDEKAAAILKGADAAIQAQYNVEIAQLDRAKASGEITEIAKATQQLTATQAARQNIVENIEKIKKQQLEGENDKGTKATAKLIETLNKNQMATDEQVRKNLAGSAELANRLHELTGKLMEFANKHLPDITKHFTAALKKLDEMLGSGDPSVPVFNGVDRALKEQESRTAGLGAKNDVLKGKITKEGAAAILAPPADPRQLRQYKSDINAFGGQEYLTAIAAGKKHGEPGTPKPDFSGPGGADYQPESQPGEGRLRRNNIPDDKKKYEGLTVSGAQAYGGGPAKPELLALARTLQGKFPGGRFTSFDDEFHQGVGAHGMGRALDFTLPAGELVDKLRAEKVAGITTTSTALIKQIKDLGFRTVLDEYTKQSERAIGTGHIHAELANGGIVNPSSNGLNATIGEGGRSELVTPLTNGRIPGMDELIERFDTMIKIMGDVGSNTDKMYRAVA